MYRNVRFFAFEIAKIKSISLSKHNISGGLFLNFNLYQKKRLEFMRWEKGEGEEKGKEKAIEFWKAKVKRAEELRRWKRNEQGRKG